MPLLVFFAGTFIGTVQHCLILELCMKLIMARNFGLFLNMRTTCTHILGNVLEAGLRIGSYSYLSNKISRMYTVYFMLYASHFGWHVSRLQINNAYWLVLYF